MLNLLSIQIAWRYLVGRKKTNAINIITGLSILGISIGTAALILILSVFNGFEGLLSGLFNAFNPDLRVVPEKGKNIVIDSSQFEAITQIPGILQLSKTLEEVALFEYKDVQEIGIIKGVDNHYIEVTGMDSMVIYGKFKLKGRASIETGVLGIGLRNKLSVNVDDKLSPITVYMPNRKSSFSSKEYKFQDIYPAGIFSVRSDNDQRYMFSSIQFARKLLSLGPDYYSSIEIKMEEDANEEKIRTAITSIIKSPVTIQNRYQQDESFLKIMNIEKWVSFLIVSLTILLIAFNLVGALWMIILEKKKDIAILKSLGFSNKSIQRLFLSLGSIMTLMGIGIGFSIALFAYFLQKQYGLIGIPAGFLIDAYPIDLKFIDFIRVTATVLFIGFMAAFLPSRKASGFGTQLRAE